jgi:hypothetical protein
MAKQQYFAMALLGMTLVLLGLMLMFSGLGLTTLNIIGILPDSLHFGVLGVFIGLGMIYFGWKFVWENESPITKFLLFLLGIYLVIIGVLLIAGGVSAFASVVPIIIGITFIDRVVGTRIWERVKRII